MNALEARYRSLLRAYPAWYRHDRGEEILGTLLEAARPDRSRPSPRDAMALILGGLRVRAWHDQRQTPAASLRAAVLLAAVLTLIPWSTDCLGVVSYELFYPSMLILWVNLAVGLLTVAAAAGAWFGHRAVVAVVAVAALAAAGLWAYQRDRIEWQMAAAAETVLALIVLTILVIGRERLPRPWLWLTGTIFAASLLPQVFPGNGPLDTACILATYAVLAATIAWSVVDARPMAAAALWIAVAFGGDSIQLFARLGPRIDNWGFWLTTIIATAVAITGIWRMRRQAML